jgi:predicted amidohydrolase
VPGREADLTGLELRSGRWALSDATGATEVVERLLVPRLVVRAGEARRLDPDTGR